MTGSAEARGRGREAPSPGARGAQVAPHLSSLRRRVRERSPPEGFWDAVLAVQLAHEASLLHDDVVDGAARRRGAPTVAAARGVPAALLLGDHLLTASFRTAVRTGSMAFVRLFARAVERTVAGEMAQGRAAGRVLDGESWKAVVAGKSGELLGCALAVAPVLEGRVDADPAVSLGRELGVLYQRLDDLLDFCPMADTGKPPLGDYRSSRWTWVLGHAPGLAFGLGEAEVLGAIHGWRPGGSPAERALAHLEHEARALSGALTKALPGGRLLHPLLQGWVERARDALAREAVGRGRGSRGTTGDGAWS